jgi:hypothetical protein
MRLISKVNYGRFENATRTNCAEIADNANVVAFIIAVGPDEGAHAKETPWNLILDNFPI